MFIEKKEVSITNKRVIFNIMLIKTVLNDGTQTLESFCFILVWFVVVVGGGVCVCVCVLRVFL